MTDHEQTQERTAGGPLGKAEEQGRGAGPMSLLSIPKTVVDRSLKLTRVPLDLARSATGLKRRAPESRAAEQQRERAGRLREQAEKAAAAKKRAAAKKAAKANKANEKREKSARLDKTEKAKEARKKIDD
jgi:hypothetical protein